MIASASNRVIRMLVRSFAACWLAWILLYSGVAQGSQWQGAPPDPSLRPKDAVFYQIVDLRMSNYIAAFEYVSPKWKRKPELQNDVMNYMWYLGDNFYPLLHTAHWFLSVTNEDHGKARVLSYIVNMEGEYRGIYWNMTKQTEGNYTKCWLTDSLETDLNPDDLMPDEALAPRDVVAIVLLFLRQREREGYDAAYRFFSQSTGAKLSRAEFQKVMGAHDEIETYTTVSIVRQISDNVVESVLLNAKDEVTTVQWNLVQGSARGCDNCWLVESMHRLGHTVEEDFSKSASKRLGGNSLASEIGDVIGRHPLIQFAIFCLVAAAVHAFVQAALLPTYRYAKGVAGYKPTRNKYVMINTSDFTRAASPLDDAHPLMELTPTPSEL